MKNKVLQKYIDQLFQSYGNSEEIEQMKQEISANAFDYYSDLVNDGVDALEATEKVMDSFGDIEELLKQPTDENKETEYTDSAKNTISNIDKVRNMIGSMMDSFNRHGNSIYSFYHDVDTLEISDTRRDIKIEKSEDDFLHVDYEENSITLIHEGNHLKIVGVNELMGRMPVKLRVPDLSNTSLTKTGDIEIEGICTETMNIYTLSSDVEISETITGVLDIHTGSGDISIENCEISELYSVSGSGDVEIESSEFIAECKIKSGSGDLDIKADHIDFLTTETGSGDVLINVKGFEELNVNTGSGDVDIYTCEQAIALHARSSSGSVVNRIATSEEGKPVKITTGSGEIYISYS